MQIHELNEAFTDLLKGAAGKVKSAVQSAGDEIASVAASANAAAVQKQREKIQAQAARYAERLKQQGYRTTQPTAPAPAPQLTTSTVAAPKAGAPTPQEQEKFQQMVQAKLGQATPAPAVQTGAKAAGPVNTQAQYAQPVPSRQAGPIMTSPDFQAAILKSGMSLRQFEELKQMVQSNPAFAQELLKKLGLKR